MKVVCIKWGDKYASSYVTKLASMVARHLPIAHEFICFTENPVEGVRCYPLLCDLPTWWSKVGLFQPGMFDGDVLYLDLDVVITGSLMPLVECLHGDPSKLWALDDFSYSLLRPKQDLDTLTRRLLGGTGTINSSVMLWNGECGQSVWDKFHPSIMDVLHGDQNWITQCLWPEGIALLPQAAVGSYKYGQLRQEPIKSVMVFHGPPKPAEVRDAWVREHWR